MKCVALIVIIGTVTVTSQEPDPCEIARVVADDGWRSPNCKMEYFGCDRYMSDGWYRALDKTSQNYLQMPNYCVLYGRCGVVFPIWLNGSHPSIEDGTVNRTACVRTLQTCCHHSYPVRIKNCTDYMVYYLESAQGCMERYCFGDSATCNTTDTINASGSTMTSTTMPKRTVTSRTEPRTTPSVGTTNLVETSSGPGSVSTVAVITSDQSLTDIETTSYTTPENRILYTTLRLITTVFVNSDPSLTGTTTTTFTSQNAVQFKGRQFEENGESDPALLIVIAVLSTLLVVLTVAVIIYIIMKMRARNVHTTWNRKESNA